MDTEKSKIKILEIFKNKRGKTITKFLYLDKIFTISKNIKFNNNIPCIKCSYLKKYVPLYDFMFRKISDYYNFEQPSRPGRRKRKHDKYGAKPRKKLNKEINGKTYRLCRELGEYRPIEEFPIKNKKIVL
jgi:hypothetical protein